jgi:hypothetical protein
VNMPGNAPLTDDLLFYDASVGEAAFFSTNGKEMNQIGTTLAGWRGTWTQILSGDFGGPTRLSDLLFYDASVGQVMCYATTGDGELTRIGTVDTTLRGSSKVLVPGQFGRDSQQTGLLAYDASAGQGAFYATDAGGALVPIGKPNTGWRKTWTHLVAGDFGGKTDCTDLMFYDAAAGQGQFFSTPGDGTLTPIGALNTGWRATWTHIVTGRFSTQFALTSLLFYDAPGGAAIFYGTTGDGQLKYVDKTGTGFPTRKTWTRLIPGTFSGASTNDVLFYDASAGTGQFCSVSGGDVSPIGTKDGWRRTWTRVLTGHFA